MHGFSDRSFSLRSFYREIDSSSAAKSPCASVWMGLGPPRVEAFCWFVVRGKISTTDNLRRGLMSIDISDICCLCRREMESVNHLFLHWHIASFIWRYLLKACGVNRSFPGSVVVFFRLGRGCLWLETVRFYGGSSLFPSFGQFGKREMIDFFLEKSCQGRSYWLLCN